MCNYNTISYTTAREIGITNAWVEGVERLNVRMTVFKRWWSVLRRCYQLPGSNQIFVLFRVSSKQELIALAFVRIRTSTPIFQLTVEKLLGDTTSLDSINSVELFLSNFAGVK